MRACNTRQKLFKDDFTALPVLKQGFESAVAEEYAPEMISEEDSRFWSADGSTPKPKCLLKREQSA
jgi:hypothetical protein